MKHDSINNIKLPPKIFHFFKDNPEADLYVLYGGRASGKTRGVILYILTFMLRTGRNVIVLRKVEEKISEGIANEIKQAVKTNTYFMHHFDILKNSIRVKETSVFHTNNKNVIKGAKPAYIEFSGLDGRGEALRGKAGFSIAFIDEAVEITQEQVRTLRDSLSRYSEPDIPFKMFLCFNPRYEDDWVYEAFVKNYKQTKAVYGKDLAVLEVNYYDNTFLPETTRKDIERDRQLLTAADFEHNWEGKLKSLTDSIIKHDYVKRLDYDVIINKHFNHLYLSCDYSVHGGSNNDFSAICLFGVDNDNHYFLIEPHLIRGDWNIQKNKTKELVIRYSDQFNKYVNLLIEDAANGSPMLSELRENFKEARCNIIPFKVRGRNKEERLASCLNLIISGKFYIPNPDVRIPSLAEYTSQLFSFPHSSHDDAVDSTTQILLYHSEFVLQPKPIVHTYTEDSFSVL